MRARALGWMLAGSAAGVAEMRSTFLPWKFTLAVFPCYYEDPQGQIDGSKETMSHKTTAPSAAVCNENAVSFQIQSLLETALNGGELQSVGFGDFCVLFVFFFLCLF